MAERKDTFDPTTLPRPQYLPESGLPPRKPVRPPDVPPMPPGLFVTEAGRRRNRKKR